MKLQNLLLQRIVLVTKYKLLIGAFDTLLESYQYLKEFRVVVSSKNNRIQSFPLCIATFYFMIIDWSGDDIRKRLHSIRCLCFESVLFNVPLVLIKLANNIVLCNLEIFDRTLFSTYLNHRVSLCIRHSLHTDSS